MEVLCYRSGEVLVDRARKDVADIAVTFGGVGGGLLLSHGPLRLLIQVVHGTTIKVKSETITARTRY